MHRIALAIDAARNRTSYQLAAGQTVPYARMRSALRTLGQEEATFTTFAIGRVVLQRCHREAYHAAACGCRRTS
ncbi:hypothetical protein [Streptomyces sp. NPDC058240]|uniref:hypothetical protein n=1 Tax=Streptomyces sp. NPDC058240 TaxID=3346396 RepID=UPI0036E4F410